MIENRTKKGSHSSQKYVVRHKEFVVGHISGLSVPDIFFLIPSFMFAAGKHNECKDMKRKQSFIWVDYFLYTAFRSAEIVTIQYV